MIFLNVMLKYSLAEIEVVAVVMVVVVAMVVML